VVIIETTSNNIHTAVFQEIEIGSELANVKHFLVPLFIKREPEQAAHARQQHEISSFTMQIMQQRTCYHEWTDAEAMAVEHRS
jgi:hypothetical protein